MYACFRTAGILVISLAAGCTDPPSNRVAPVRPVKTMVVVAGEEPHIRQFPGKVEAARQAELAFQVPGLLVKLHAREGQKVAKGELIGQLRQDEFQARLKSLEGQLGEARAGLRRLKAGERPEQQARLESQVRAAEAKLINAHADFDRDSRLVQSGAVSRQDFDRSEALYRVAQEELKAARQLLEKSAIGREEDIDAQEAQVRGLEGRVVEANLQLTDSSLRAPYDGVIAQRFVEENQNIRASQPVVKFQDVEEIEVAVDVPETVMAADLRTSDIVQLVAEFSGVPGQEFPVRIKEIAQRADPTMQTFNVRVAMKSQPDLRVLPGMTATVTMTYHRSRVLSNRILVPVSAVFSEPGGQSVAWAIGADDTVSRRPVKLGEVTGGRVEILEGLKPGERIAIAGVRFLSDGMKVSNLGDSLGGGPP